MTDCYIDQDNNWKCLAEGSSPLDKAMAICVQKEDPEATNALPVGIPDWTPAWQACRKVLKLWMETDRAKQIQEMRAQNKKDREFIDQVLKDFDK